MHLTVDRERGRLSALCRRFGVARLDVFGSAARGADFDAERSDVDLLVEFVAPDDSLTRFLDFRDALEALLGQPSISSTARRSRPAAITSAAA